MGNESIIKRLLSVLIVLPILGCSYVDVREDGFTRVRGIAQVEILNDTKGEKPDGTWGPTLTVRSIGVSLKQSIDGLDMNIGFLQDRHAMLRNCADKNVNECLDASWHGPAFGNKRGEADPLGEAKDTVATEPLEGTTHFAISGGKSNSRTYTGFIDLIVQMPTKQERAGHVSDVLAIGLGTVSTDLGSSINAGYHRATVATILSNAKVIGDPMLVADQDIPPIDNNRDP